MANLLELYKAMSIKEQRQFADLLRRTGFFTASSSGTDHALLSNRDYASAAHTGFEPTIGFTPEDVANKDTDGTLAANSDTNYCSQKATKTYVDGKSAADMENYARTQNDGRIERTSDVLLTFNVYQVGIYDSANTVWKLVIPAAAPTLDNTDNDLDANPLAVNSNYDIFAQYVSATECTLVAKKWTNDTTRAVTPAEWEGVLCYDNTTDNGKKRRFLGTVRMRSDAGTAKFTDTVTQRFVSNYYNRELVTVSASAQASGAACTDDAYTLWTNWTSPGIGVVSCWGSEFSFMAFGAFAATNDASSFRLECAIAVDGTAGGTSGQTGTGASATVLAREPIYPVSITPGYHYLDMMRRRLTSGSGSPTHFLCSIGAVIWR